MATKIVKQFALSHSTTYTLLDSFYSGGIHKGAESCQNCGKLITHIARVQDKEGTIFTVGMDCAATLAGIKEGVELTSHQYAFSQAKQVRNRLLQLKKKYGDQLLVTVSLVNGQQFLDTKITGGFGASPYWISFRPDEYERYISEMITEFL